MVNNKIGVILSGGGFRGVAHLGIVQYMRELGIEPDVVSRASAGAFIGAFIAAGYSPEEIFDFAKKERFFNYSSIIKGGGLSTDSFEKIMRAYFPHDSFQGLKIPIRASWNRTIGINVNPLISIRANSVIQG